MRSHLQALSRMPGVCYTREQATVCSSNTDSDTETGDFLFHRLRGILGTSSCCEKRSVHASMLPGRLEGRAEKTRNTAPRITVVHTHGVDGRGRCETHLGSRCCF